MLQKCLGSCYQQMVRVKAHAHCDVSICLCDVNLDLLDLLSQLLTFDVALCKSSIQLLGAGCVLLSNLGPAAGMHVLCQ